MTSGGSTKSGAHTVRVVMAGGALGFNWLPVHVARQSGFFDRAGLSVELLRAGSVDKATAAVKSGEAQIAITPPEGAVADYVSGGDLRILAGNVNRLPLSLVANPRFKRVEELKGRTLGTSSLTEGTAIYTREMLARHGLQYPRDYSFAVVGVHPARWKALQEGTINAAVQLIPLNFVAFDAGYSNLGEVSDYIPEIIFTALIARAQWLDANGPAVETVLRCLREATDWLHDSANDAATIPLVMEITQSDEKYAWKSLEYMRAKQVFARSLEIPSPAFDKTIELMVKADLLEANKTTIARHVLDEVFQGRASAR